MDEIMENVPSSTGCWHKVKVVLGVFLHDMDPENEQPIMRCGFFEDRLEEKLYLPNQELVDTAPKHAVSLVKECTTVPIDQIDIVQVGFFDPIERNTKERQLSLAYKILLLPGMPVNSHLRFMSYEQLAGTSKTIRTADKRIFREGITF